MTAFTEDEQFFGISTGLRSIKRVDSVILQRRVDDCFLRTLPEKGRSDVTFKVF